MKPRDSRCTGRKTGEPLDLYCVFCGASWPVWGKREDGGRWNGHDELARHVKRLHPAKARAVPRVGWWEVAA